MCSRAKGAYRYWSNCRRLKPLIKNEHRLLLHSREQHKVVRWANDRTPLVSVVIPTWNRGELLAARTIPSVLTQTYPQLEIVIVGDCCTDNTAQLLASLKDPRIHFLNLPERGQYPSGKKALWQVAGSVPKNKGLDLCRGNWIAPLDDDDVFTPDHIESLLGYAQMNDLELVYGKMRIEETTGRWKEKGLVNQQMSIQNSTMLFRSYLKLFRSDINAWRYGLTGDYQRTIRYRETGVRIGYLNQVVALMPLRPGQTKMGLSAEDRPGATIISESPAMIGQ
jgi:glycosyltransferase involved in cell wall biosynthesis